MLQRNPSLVDQVKAHLKQRIIDAEFGAGRIPSEVDLASQLRVSRNTVRDALGRLEMEGVIFRRQGAGTFVNRANLLIKTRLEEIVPYDRLIREHGYSPSVQLIEVKEKPVEPAVASLLSLQPDDPALVVHKLFLADDRPVIFSQTHIPTGLVRRPYEFADFRAPVYQFLPAFCDQSLAYYLTDIVPLIAPAWLVERFGLQAECQPALISFDEVGHNEDNQPVIRAVSYFRDDLLRLRLMRRYTK
jgi:GntR family transcriptional regulator